MQSPSMVMSVPAVKGRWNPNSKFVPSAGFSLQLRGNACLSCCPYLKSFRKQLRFYSYIKTNHPWKCGGHSTRTMVGLLFVVACLCHSGQSVSLRLVCVLMHNPLRTNAFFPRPNNVRTALRPDDSLPGSWRQMSSARAKSDCLWRHANCSFES